MAEGISIPAPKSRHGCLRCKKRRMKCDETKPACLRCSEKQLTCPGYALNLRWSRKHEAPLQTRQRKTPRPIASRPDIQALGQAREGHPVCMTNDTQPPNSNSPDGMHDNFFDDDTVWSLLDQSGLEEPFDSTGHDFGLMSSIFSEVDDLVSTPEPVGTQIPTGTGPQPTDILSMGHGFSYPGTSQSAHTHTRSANTAVRSTTTIPPGSQISAPNLPDGLGQLSIPHTIHNQADALVPYFFQAIIPLYCCYDSDFSSMRLLCQRLWQSSGPLFHIVQSMAAATLRDHFPQLSAVARKEYRDAEECLQNPAYTNGLDKLLALMLLGQTASWHLPTDLARPYFLAAREAIAKAHQNGDDGLDFFIPAMDYWEMLLSFLNDRPDIPAGSQSNGPNPVYSFPHPFSGIAGATIRILSRVGSLVLRTKKQMSMMVFMAESDVRAFRRALAEAQSLEEALLLYRAKDSCWMDTGDDTTTLSDLEKIDEAYRCVGLLQLYRVFPDLLTRRYRPWSSDDLLNPPEPLTIPTAQQRNTWLTQLALHILDILGSVNSASRTRSVQPFLLVAVSSELRLAESGTSTETNVDISSLAIQVANGRQFIRQRLSAYTHILPLPKVRMIYDLVKVIWDEIDSGKADTYWLDVALRRSMGTLMG